MEMVHYGRLLRNTLNSFGLLLYIKYFCDYRFPYPKFVFVFLLASGMEESIYMIIPLRAFQ